MSKYYIVYKTGKGYFQESSFEGDKYSKNWIDAKKYKSMTTACHRFNIYNYEVGAVEECLNKLDKKSINELRLKKFSKITGTEYVFDLNSFNFFSDGKIEKIEQDKNTLKLIKEVGIEVHKHLLKIRRPFDAKKIKVHKLQLDLYNKLKPINDSNDEFWD